MASRRVATSSTLRRGAVGVASGGRGGASTSRGGSSTSRGGGESGGGGGGSTVSSSSGNVDSIVGAGESGESARSALANIASDATTRRNCCHDSFCALSAPSRRSRAREKASPSTPNNRGAEASSAQRAAWTVIVASMSERKSKTDFRWC